MVRHYYMGSFTDIEPRNIYALLLQLFHLTDETFRIDNNTISNHAGCIGIKDSRGDKTEYKFPLFVNNAMSNVSPSSIAHDKICTHGKFVNNFAFAFASPLGTNNCYYRHNDLSFLAFFKV